MDFTKAEIREFVINAEKSTSSKEVLWRLTLAEDAPQKQLRAVHKHWDIAPEELVALNCNFKYGLAWDRENIAVTTQGIYCDNMRGRRLWFQRLLGTEYEGGYMNMYFDTITSSLSLPLRCSSQLTHILDYVSDRNRQEQFQDLLQQLREETYQPPQDEQTLARGREIFEKALKYEDAGDYEKMKRLYEIAALHGNPGACNNLALCYENKKYGIAQDSSTAEVLYRYAAENGSVIAMANLSYLYSHGTNGFEQDYDEAFRWAKMGAENDDLRSIQALGICYQKGQGCHRNYQQANDLFRQTAGQNYKFGMYMLGKNYEAGNGFEKDLDTALYWYQKAAAKGHAKAQECVQRLRAEAEKAENPDENA